jgi:DNA-binding NarL/FixJ family response regulator
VGFVVGSIPMIRLILVDDQNLIRRGLRALLSTDPELEVIGEGENGQESIDLVATLQPDIVLMDVRMPIMDGVVATGKICQRFPQIKVLVLTTFDDTEYVSQALQAGASGYLLKDTPFEELTKAIRLVSKGYTQIGPGLAPKILDGGTEEPEFQLTITAI